MEMLLSFLYGYQPSWSRPLRPPLATRPMRFMTVIFLATHITRFSCSVPFNFDCADVHI
jgi:hypothetical protein